VKIRASTSKEGEFEMYRWRLRVEVLYGHFPEFLQNFEEIKRLMGVRGWKQPTLWAPVVGKGNEVVWEIEYPDFVTFDRERQAFYADAEAMRLWRAPAEHIVQGSVHDELVEPVAPD
jgi:hypothetical protein